LREERGLGGKLFAVAEFRRLKKIRIDFGGRKKTERKKIVGSTLKFFSRPKQFFSTELLCKQKKGFRENLLFSREGERTEETEKFEWKKERKNEEEEECADSFLFKLIPVILKKKKSEVRPFFVLERCAFVFIPSLLLITARKILLFAKSGFLAATYLLRNLTMPTKAYFPKKWIIFVSKF
jgi:hypothetical protein